jgi:hypothetical protein
MTPPPATAAAAGHQRTVRRGATPRGPRRVSGPSRAAGGARAARANVATAAAAAAVVNPNQLPFEVPLGRRPAVARPVGLPRNHTPLVHRLSRVAEHTWLDRLLRSRAWIVVVGIGLIGLVFMQVSLLKLNSGMGQAVERATVLERQNAGLGAKVSELESNDRIQVMAKSMGMLLPASDGVRYLGRGGKRIGGGEVTSVPSQGEASTALLPAAPLNDTEHPATGVTAADGTTVSPQTTSSVPGAAAPVPQSTTSSTGTTQSGTATPTTAAGTAAPASTATATGAAPAIAAAPAPATTGSAAAPVTSPAPTVARSDTPSSSATGGAIPGA